MQREDVDVVVGQRVGDVAQEPGAVERLDLERDDVGRRRVVVPLDLDEPLGLGGQAAGVRAVGPVDRDAAAPGDEPDDLVAGHRGAAAREPDEDVVETLDVHPGRAAARVAPGRPAGGDRDLLFAAGHLAPQPLRDRLARHVALTDRGLQRLDVGVVERLGDLLRAASTRSGSAGPPCAAP